MNTPTITTNLSIDLRSGYYLNDRFSSTTQLAILEHASYMRLLDLLTPEQRAQLIELAYDDEFHAIAGFVI